MSRPLDPRAWLVWMIAASLPALVGRNPFVLVATMLAVLGVRAVWGTMPRFASWRVVVRLAALFAAISVLFNLLTVHVGDLVIAELPEELPIIGGIVTLNALIYGLLSGAALVTLVLIGTTVAAVLDWTALLRLLPSRLSLLAVAGSVAWVLVPQTIAAFAEIREAQLARGHRLRGVRDVGPLLAPLLAGGLERSFTLAEALEARGFGAEISPQPQSEGPHSQVDGPHPQPRPRGHPAQSWERGAFRASPRIGGLGGPSSLLIGVALVAGTTGAYVLAVGRPLLAICLFVIGGVGFVVGTSEGRPTGQVRRTRYREPVWGRPEWTVTIASSVVLVVEIAVLAIDPAAFAYDPYPSLTAPPANLALLAVLSLLLAPATVVPR